MTLTLLSVVLSEGRNPGRLVRSSENGTTVLKSSPIHKLWAVGNCSVGERHTIL